MQSPCLTPQLRKALLAQTCCGIPELCNFLNDEVDLLWKCQDHCTDRLRYIYTQLGLIEAAQIFARGKIDTMIHTAESNTQEKYTAFNTTRTDAERDSSGKTCHWAASTSQQFFNRDSTDYTVGFSDYRLLYTSEFKNNGYDKSCRHTTGHGFHMSRVETTHNGNHSDFRFHTDTRATDTFGGTDPLIPLQNLQLVGWSFQDSFPFINPPHLNVDPFQIVPAHSGEQICPTPTQDNPFPPCPVGSFPSVGWGYNGRFQFAFTTPTLGTVNITYANGENKRQYYHCTGSSSQDVRRDLTESSDSVIGTTDALEKDNQTYSSEQTDIQHLVRKYGITVRRGNTDLDAEDKGHGRSDGIAHSESERNVQGNGYQTSRAESETVRHSENHLRRTETANDDQVSNKYGQISTHLAKLWDRVWEQYLQLERQIIAIPMAGSMSCDLRGSICCPVRVSYADLKRVPLHAIH